MANRQGLGLTYVKVVDQDCARIAALVNFQSQSIRLCVGEVLRGKVAFRVLGYSHDQIRLLAEEAHCSLSQHVMIAQKHTKDVCRPVCP